MNNEVMALKNSDISVSLKIDDSDQKRLRFRRLLERYYRQITIGCGDSACINENCASNIRVTPLSAPEAVKRSLQLLKAKALLCPARKKAKLDEASDDYINESLTKSVERINNSDAVKESIPTRFCYSKFSTIRKKAIETNDYFDFVEYVESIFANEMSLAISFTEDKSSDDGEANKDEPMNTTPCADTLELTTTCKFNINQSLLSLVYADITGLENSFVDAEFASAISILLSQTDVKPVTLAILFENINLHSPEYLDTALPKLCKAAASLSVEQQADIALYWTMCGKERLANKVDILQQLITYKTVTSHFSKEFAVNDHPDIVAGAQALNIAYCASLKGGVTTVCEYEEMENHLRAYLDSLGHPFSPSQPIQHNDLAAFLDINPALITNPLIEPEMFINEPLNDAIRIEIEYIHYLEKKEDSASTRFSFLRYPFLLSTCTKQNGLMYDNRIRMYNERQRIDINAVLSILFNSASSHQLPFLKVTVRRDHLIEDALQQVELHAMENPYQFKKQLYVEFDGEQGVDEGGVSKEFFQLIIEAIFNADYGMFTYNTSTNVYWFNPESFEADSQFSLVGLLLGLAIYNSIILDIRLPLVAYRKLLGWKGRFSDLKDVNNHVYNSLLQLLAYEGDNFEEDFMLNYQITYSDCFGRPTTHDLVENGEQIPVTMANRQDYVDRYVDFMLNSSIERQFNAFRRGFFLVVNESPLQYFFRPEEIELLVCGSQDLDFTALEETTKYDGGFEDDSPVIQWFWEVLYDMNADQKKKFLSFTTGSDRVPLGGLSRLKLIVARNGDDSDRLPTAHTCFNVLLLPHYSTREKLKERLLTAITHAKGFGLQ